jgi:8-oxo-dGTP pyrophosphatase MutT (NUDIX family)/phosphohistidine phosphatase SixA
VTVYAAGVVCWRVAGSDIEILLVHREQYDDWAFPKGKQDKGEFLQETAVREVEEEAGIKVRLGRKIDIIHYKVGKGEDKFVSYWASKVSNKAISKSKFKPNKEIADIRWLPSAEAMELLTYEHDKRVLAQVLGLHEKAELETRALVLLRHAKATPRDQWDGEEAKRPLLPEGQRQAKRLVQLLDAYGPKRLVSSPWTRCKDTVKPYSKYRKRTLILRSQLTELRSALNPKKTKDAVEDLFDQKATALLCSHRPALPTITMTLASRAEGAVKSAILEATTLHPGEFVVMRFSMGKKPRFVDAERVSWTVK